MRRLSVFVVLILLLAVGGTLPVFGESEVLFGEPSASGAFGESITFETTFEAAEAPQRVELLVRTPGDVSDRVNIAVVEQVGEEQWRATVFQGGHTVPNTSYEYRFRAITDEGSVVGPVAEHRIDDTRIEWQRLQGDRVTVWWHDGDERFAQRALDIAEEAITSAGAMLGVSDVEPVDFYIYADSRQFRQAMGPSTRENVGGQAHPGIRTLFGLIEPRQIDSDWVEELVVHELTHLVFDEAVSNPYQYPPRWLNEGLAVYLSQGYASADRRQVEGAAGGGTIIPLEGLGGQFPTRSTRIGLAYAESVSAVDYLVETYGEESLVELITLFADGTGLDAAFYVATGDGFAAFDDAWLASLGADRPDAYGPQESEPGPVPEAWVGDPDALLR